MEFPSEIPSEIESFTPISIRNFLYTHFHEISSGNFWCERTFRANNKKSSKITHYDWERLNTVTETQDIFIIKVKTIFESLQDTTACYLLEKGNITVKLHVRKLLLK